MKQRLLLSLAITKNGEYWNEFTSTPVVEVGEAPTAHEYFKATAARIAKIDTRSDGPFAVTLSIDGNVVASADSLSEKGVNKVVDRAVQEMTALREVKIKAKAKKK